MLLKRITDIAASVTALLILHPLLALVAVAIRIADGSPVLFGQVRVGRGGTPFTIYKFRTMRSDPAAPAAITVGHDPRITRLGRLLRATKVDELPQLVNVLKGEMSLVGPRPELPEYVALYADAYREILTVRPGLTDLASLKYSDEAAYLAASEDPHETYLKVVLPDKLRLAQEYARTRSFGLDMRIILSTVARLLGSRRRMQESPSGPGP